MNALVIISTEGENKLMSTVPNQVSDIYVKTMPY